MNIAETKTAGTNIQHGFFGDISALENDPPDLDDDFPFGANTPGEENWKALVTVLNQNYHEPDIEAVRVVLSAIAAHQFESSDTVWPMLIGPPGSMKTELLNGINGLSHVHLIDEVTPNTFISGQLDSADKDRPKSKEPKSLLHRIGSNGVIAFPDFSTVIAMNADKRNSIMSQLRRIYDGQYRREFGHTDGIEERQWEGRITVIAAVTPDIDRHYGTIQALGERFVAVRWPRPSGPVAAIKAARQDRPKVKKAVREVVHKLMSECTADEPVISDERVEALASGAEFVVHARTQVPRDGARELCYKPEPEAGTRLTIQLVQMAKGSASIGQRAEVNDMDCRIALRAAADCIPSLRRAVIEQLIGITRPDTVVQRQTKDRIIEDLEAVGLVSGGRIAADKWKLLKDSGLFGCQ